MVVIIRNINQKDAPAIQRKISYKTTTAKQFFLLLGMDTISAEC